MYEDGDAQKYANLKVKINHLEMCIKTSWHYCPGDEGKLNTARKQADALLRKMNNRDYDKEILKPLYE